MTKQELKTFLEEKAELYNRRSFLDSDPIQIPHQFTKRADIEIMAFLTATIAWGQRRTIINNGIKLIDLFGNEPYRFVMQSSDGDHSSLQSFTHRTFNGEDLIRFVKNLKSIYERFDTLENAFAEGINFKERISNFKAGFFNDVIPNRSRKHVSDPLKGSAAKRINMFLRWMIRNDNRGVDFGIWTTFKPAELFVPLDVHSGNVARKLGLLGRQQNDWQAVEELTGKLRELDHQDPVKYDFALFGLGAFEGF